MLMPLGDAALLVRFGEALTEEANLSAIAFSQMLQERTLMGVREVVPNLVSVVLHFDSTLVDFAALSGEVRLLLSRPLQPTQAASFWTLPVRFGGAEGPDLDEVAKRLGLSRPEFIRAHNAHPLRVLAVGFAPGFVYSGLHPEAMRLPRRAGLHPRVSAGSVLFAAGQTAIAATPIPTGWHVIGRTDFANFDPAGDPPTRLKPGDLLSFVEMAP